MDEQTLSLTLRVDGGEGADAEVLDELTAGLRQQLLETDVRSVEPVRGEAPPPGTRGAEAVAVGGLLVTLARSPDLLKHITAVIQDWLAGSRARTVEVQMGGDTLKVGGLSSEEQKRLIDVFVTRHAAERAAH